MELSEIESGMRIELKESAPCYCPLFGSQAGVVLGTTGGGWAVIHLDGWSRPCVVRAVALRREVAP